MSTHNERIDLFLHKYKAAVSIATSMSPVTKEEVEEALTVILEPV